MRPQKTLLTLYLCRKLQVFPETEEDDLGAGKWLIEKTVVLWDPIWSSTCEQGRFPVTNFQVKNGLGKNIRQNAISVFPLKIISFRVSFVAIRVAFLVGPLNIIFLSQTHEERVHFTPTVFIVVQLPNQHASLSGFVPSFFMVSPHIHLLSLVSSLESPVPLFRLSPTKQNCGFCLCPLGLWHHIPPTGWLSMRELYFSQSWGLGVWNWDPSMNSSEGSLPGSQTANFLLQPHVVKTKEVRQASCDS